MSFFFILRIIVKRNACKNCVLGNVLIVKLVQLFSHLVHISFFLFLLRVLIDFLSFVLCFDWRDTTNI